MQQQEAGNLLDRYLSGDVSSREKMLVDNWYNQLADQRSLEEGPDFEHLNNELWIGSCRRAGIGASGKQKKLWPLIAAALLLLFSVGVIFWLRENPNKQSVVQSPSDIPPGGNRASLTLADGKIIALDEAQSGIIIGDTLTYADGSPVVKEQEKDQGRTLALRTPRGGMYRLTLPDGTKVWLNAASTLTYPEMFAKGDRTVFLTGEAYFEVAKSKKPGQPFRINSEGQTIEVLGTIFNVSAYPDEPVMTTTLLEGTIRLTNHRSEQSAVLTPGEQASVAEAKTSISEVDAAAFAAWKNGDFVFGKRDFTATMRDVARWYDIEIVYETERSPESIRIGGWVSRKKPLSAVINLLEMTGVVQTQFSGRKLIITDGKGTIRD